MLVVVVNSKANRSESVYIWFWRYLDSCLTGQLKKRKLWSTWQKQAKQLRKSVNRERYSQYTIKNYMKFLSMLLKRGANLNDPDDVKDKIAEQQWSASGKNIAIAAYTIFASLSGIHWDPPIYKAQQKLPFIPLENELDALIAMSNKKLATVLQLMKEGGMRIGEALALSWIDVDLENNTVTVNSPEKEGRPRMLRISYKLAAMINALPRKDNRVFGATPYNGVHSTFVRTRSRAAEKLQNPRLRYIKFHTFRHWKATMEYHKTKDLLHVRQMLGHRKIETTLLYTQLITFENDDYHSAVAKTVDEARSLVETGFEYICTHDDIMIFRKRK
jgi:integrase